MLKVGLIGCGHIAETYFRSQKYFNNIEIISCADINAEASKKCAQEYNIEAQEVDDLLIDKKINIVLNLTTPQAHYEIIKKTLLAGKHSYCEKPLSTYCRKFLTVVGALLLSNSTVNLPEVVVNSI